MEQLQVYLASWDAEWNNSRCIWLPGMLNGTTPGVFGFLGCRMEQLHVYLASWDAEWNNSRCIWLPGMQNGTTPGVFGFPSLETASQNILKL